MPGSWKCPSLDCPATPVDPVRVTVAGDLVDMLRCERCGHIYPEADFHWSETSATVHESLDT
jgi:hypothetical protein